MEHERMRMGLVSKADMMAASSARLIVVDDAGGVNIELGRGRRKVLVKDTAGAVVRYQDRHYARRAIRRLRPDLRPTEL